MAQIISIGTTQHVDWLKGRLGRGLKLFEKNGRKIRLQEKSAGEFTFISCCLDGRPGYRRADEQTGKMVKKYVADIISDLILSYWEAALLENIIGENYDYYGAEEKRIIFHYALLHVNRKASEPRRSAFWSNRKRKILKKVSDYLKLNNQIVIDGFIRFRLKEYIEELREATAKAVDDFMLEKEYKEFIRLLQYFVAIQDPGADVVHVLISAGGAFKLFDEKLRPIRNDYLGGCWVDIIENEVNFEDLLVSALITIAPGQIVFHFRADEKYQATVETIKNVFTGRVSECPGCRLCLATRAET